MLYRLNIIFMFFCSIAFSQVQFSRIVPIDYYHGDGKSMGMGNSMVSNCSSSLAIISNPAKLASLSNSFYFQSFLSSISERRSTIISDMWGDFLANADYVANEFWFFRIRGGLSSSINIGLINPDELINKIIKAKSKLNNTEGFIRQLFWREYQRYCNNYN